MKAKKEKRKKRPMSLAKKIILFVVAAVALVVAVYVAYYLIHFMFYKSYKKNIKEYGYEAGSEMKFISEANPSVPDFKLVCENDILKLYTNPQTANIAVYDKRNKEITYTNPINADQDSVANPTNKNFMKSQFLLYFLNDSASSAYMDSYSKCVKLKQFDYEKIENGIRYNYKIGDTKVTKKSDTGEEVEGTYFEIPLEYRLDGDSVVVSVPTNHIVEHGHGHVYKLQLLRYFGAGHVDDTGYTLVPNSSGSIIYFNNGRVDAAQYNQYVYDIDPMIQNYTTLENLKAARLPIYAICSEKKSVFVEIEGGAPLASISSNVSGTYCDYNYTFPTFLLRNVDNLVMFGAAKIDTLVMEDDYYDCNIAVRYSFPSSDYKGYAGMANYYRERLIGRGILKEITEASDIPFYYDVISGVKEVGHFLGAQYLHCFSMTDFDEAGKMAESLAEQGITNQVMNLQGWFNGGFYHDAPHDIRVIGKLGGKRNLESLNAKLNEIGGKLYADVAFQRVSFADEHFNYSAESSRYYGSGYVAAFGLIDPSTLRNTSNLGYTENRYNVLSPKFVDRYVNSFTKKFVKLDVDGISLRDLGKELASDKRRTEMINRQQALDIIIAQLDTIDKTERNVMVDEGNDYSFGVADDIINVPYVGNDFFICDEDVPFYQMVLHGCINYSTELLNDENNFHMDELILHLLETGSSPHYVFTWKDANEMKETALNRFYSTTFDKISKTAGSIYTQVNEVLKKVSNARIVNHEIEGTARAVTYSNGIVIYVNYGDKEAEIGGVTVPAKSYRMEGDK